MTKKGRDNLQETAQMIKRIQDKKVYVDGKEIEYFKIYNAFIGINLDKGDHQIKMIYISPYIKEGIILSISGIILTIIYIKKIKIIYFKALK